MTDKARGGVVMDNGFTSTTQATLLGSLAQAASTSNFALDSTKTQAALGYQLAELGERLGDHMSYLTMFEPHRSNSNDDGTPSI